MYKGEVIRNESLDPLYKIKFSYSNDKCYISDCSAIYTRKAPMPTVVFDDYTDYLIERLGLGEDVQKSLRLEIGRTVCDYIFKSLR